MRLWSDASHLDPRDSSSAPAADDGKDGAGDRKHAAAPATARGVEAGSSDSVSVSGRVSFVDSSDFFDALDDVEGDDDDMSSRDGGSGPPSFSAAAAGLTVSAAATEAAAGGSPGGMAGCSAGMPAGGKAAAGGVAGGSPWGSMGSPSGVGDGALLRMYSPNFGGVANAGPRAGDGAAGEAGGGRGGGVGGVAYANAGGAAGGSPVGRTSTGVMAGGAHANGLGDGVGAGAGAADANGGEGGAGTVGEAVFAYGSFDHPWPEVAALVADGGIPFTLCCKPWEQPGHVALVTKHLVRRCRLTSM